jgi:DNA repair exonuclease SbcCD ATPase subunit
MEPLIFKIETQADDSGVRNYDKSLGGLDVSSKKASGALKSFSRELINAKSGADVAAAGAESLSRILEKSLAGVVVIGGVKIVTDQINKMSEILRTVGESTSVAVTQLERMGEIKGIDDAIKGVGAVNQSLDTTIQKLGSIQEGNWFTKFIASTTGTTEELKKQQETLEKLRDSLLAYGFAAERDNAEKMSQLNDEQKQYEAIQQKLKQNLETINQIKDANDRASATRNANALAGIETQNLTNKLMEEQAKKEEELHQKRIKELEERAQKERELAEAQQKRFNDLYNAEIKAQEATQKRIDENNKAQEEAQKKTDQLNENKKEGKRVAGAGGLDLAARAPGQRETSFSRGLRERIPMAQEQGRREGIEAVRKDIGEQLKAQGKPSRSQDIDREISSRTLESERLASQLKVPGFKELKQAGLDRAEQTIAETKRITDMAKEASNFSTNLSNLKTPFDQAMKSADDFSKGMINNEGNMVGEFLKVGDQSKNLGDKLGDAGEAVNKFSEELKKTPTPGETGTAAGKGKGGDTGSLSSIEKLLQKNFDELKAYAHAT